MRKVKTSGCKNDDDVGYLGILKKVKSGAVEAAIDCDKIERRELRTTAFRQIGDAMELLVILVVKVFVNLGAE